MKNEHANKNDVIDLINQLPEELHAASDKIKYEIAPLLLKFNRSVRLGLMSRIRHRTNASSIREVQQIIDSGIKEIDNFVSDAIKTALEGQHDTSLRIAADLIERDPLLFRKMIDDVNLLGVSGERRTIGLTHLTIDSRLLPMTGGKPHTLSLKISGKAGSGKSFILSACLKLHPPNAIHLIINGSKKSLYTIEGGLEHKVLVLVEGYALELKGKKDSEFALALRSLVSEGVLYYDRADGSGVTRHMESRGPTSFVTTTTRQKLEVQVDDRTITTNTDTSPEQTRVILEQMARSAMRNKSAVDSKIQQVWQYYRENLDSKEVVIPYAGDIVDFIGLNELPDEARRAYGRVLSAIMIVTLLYQKQRNVDGQGRLIADYADYAIVHQLMHKDFSERIGDPNNLTDKKIKTIQAAGRITPGELARRVNVTGPVISNWHPQLIEKGFLRWCDNKGRSFADQAALDIAKHKGQAYLCVAGGKSLPTPFDLTGDPRWDVGGELQDLYDLHLDERYDPNCTDADDGIDPLFQQGTGPGVDN
jgi:hypothetical protein